MFHHILRPNKICQISTYGEIVFQLLVNNTNCNDNDLWFQSSSQNMKIFINFQ